MIFLTCVVCGAILLIIIVIVAGAVYVKKQRLGSNSKINYDNSSSSVYLFVKCTFNKPRVGPVPVVKIIVFLLANLAKSAKGIPKVITRSRNVS